MLLTKLLAKAVAWLGQLFCLLTLDMECALFSHRAPQPWPRREVPYVLDTSFAPDYQRRILRAMDAIERRTCVRFRPLGAQTTFLEVRSNQEWECSSNVGINEVGKSIMTVDTRGCAGHRILLHELLHTIGLHHMHQRNDRNDHVRVCRWSIKLYAACNFVKLFSETYGLPYDLSSIMHYGNQTFAVDKNAYTVLPLRPWQGDMGPKDDLSPGDVAWVNRVYGCRCHYLGDDLPGAMPYEEWLSATTVKHHHLAPVDASECR